MKVSQWNLEYNKTYYEVIYTYEAGQGSVTKRFYFDNKKEAVEAARGLTEGRYVGLNEIKRQLLF